MDANELLLSPIAHMPPPRIIAGLTSEQAAMHIQGASHSVVEILAHMVFWQSWFLDRCSGMATPMAAKAVLGWPPATSLDWESLKERFIAGLEKGVAMATDQAAREQLVEPAIEFPPIANYTIGDAITHIGVHNAHHLGQIIVLRQIMGAWPPPEGSWTW